MQRTTGRGSALGDFPRVLPLSLLVRFPFALTSPSGNSYNTGVKSFGFGEVEVYDLTGHPKAKRAYAWSHIDGKKDDKERFVAVLEIPPVDSAQRAVQVQIVKDAKGIK